MRERQRVTSYWSVWHLVHEHHGSDWVPWAGNYRTRGEAKEAMAALQRETPEGRFAIVKTRNERVT